MTEGEIRQEMFQQAMTPKMIDFDSRRDTESLVELQGWLEKTFYSFKYKDDLPFSLFMFNRLMQVEQELDRRKTQ